MRGGNARWGRARARQRLICTEFKGMEIATG
jgi:hypothetical protein